MLRNIATGLLLACAFVLSLFYRSYEDPLQFPVIALLAPAFIIALPRRQMIIPSSAPVMALIALTILNLVAFAVSTIPFSSQIALCIFCALPVTFFSLSLQENKSRITITLAAITGLLALWAVAQTFITNTRAAGPFLDPNMLAAILGIGLICASGLSLEKKSPTFIALSFLLFAGLVSTGSRSGLATTLIALAVLLTATPVRIQRKNIILTTLAALAILVVLGAPLLQQLGEIANISSPSFTDRLALWHSAWTMALDHPLIGTGPGTFHFYYPAYRNSADQSLGTFAHNDPLQMATEMGLAAPILFYILLALILRRTMRALRSTDDPAKRLAILTPFAALLTLALQAHVNYPLYLLPVMIACGALLALWHAATVNVLGHGITTFATISAPRRIAVTFAGMLIMSCILGLSFTSAAGLYYLQKSRTAADPQTSLIALGWAEQTAPLSFIDPEIDMARTNLHLIDRTGSIKSSKLKDSLLTDTTRLLDNAAYWNPAWAEIDYLKGEMYQIREQKGPMLESWFTTIRKNPMHFTARKSLALALRSEGRHQDAIDVITDGLKYPHPLPYREWAISFIEDKNSK